MLLMKNMTGCKSTLAYWYIISMTIFIFIHVLVLWWTCLLMNLSLKSLYQSLWEITLSRKTCVEYKCSKDTLHWSDKLVILFSLLNHWLPWFFIYRFLKFSAEYSLINFTLHPCFNNSPVIFYFLSNPYFFIL